MIELAIFENALGFPCRVSGFQVLAAVGLAFAADNRDARLHELAGSIQLKRDNCQALLRIGGGEFGELLLRQEEASRPLRVVALRRIGRLVGRDGHADDDRLAPGSRVRRFTCHTAGSGAMHAETAGTLLTSPLVLSRSKLFLDISR